MQGEAKAGSLALSDIAMCLVSCKTNSSAVWNHATCIKLSLHISARQIAVQASNTTKIDAKKHD